MRDARLNPHAIAKQNGGQVVKVADIGGGFGLAGFGIEMVMNPEKTRIGAVLVATVCQASSLAVVQSFAQIPIIPLAEFDVEDLRRKCQRAFGVNVEEPEEESAEEVPS